MITATRRWLRQNRAAFAVGFGAIGVGYFAGQYVYSKITEARERIAGDRIAKEKYKILKFSPQWMLTEQLASTIST